MCLNVAIAMQFEGSGELIHSRDNIAVSSSRMSSNIGNALSNLTRGNWGSSNLDWLFYFV